MNNFIIVSHKFLTQPDDELVAFLNKKKKENVLHICHSFSDAPDRRSFYTWYKKGKIYKEEKTHDFRSIFESFLYFKEWYFTTKWIIGTNTKWDVYIGMDGMCVLFGNILKLTKLIKKTVFWAIDFVPSHRFSSKVKNYIYHRINIHGYIYSDEMWDLSPRMAVARKKFLNIHTKTYRFHRVVPYGMWVNRIRTYEFNDCDQNTIVFMGHLIEKQGVQLLIQSLPELLEKK
jgi:glycosyltransferase involved in cell wall biosynthesis